MEYQPHYDQMSKLIAKEPLPSTSIRDKPCLGVLVVIVGAFLGIGIYEIVEYSKIGPVFNQQYSYGGSGPESSPQLSVGQHFGIILAGVSIGLILSFMYLMVVRYMPKCMVYTLIIITLALGVIMLVLSILTKIIALIVIFATILGVYVLLLFCYRREIEIGIQLVVASTYFLTANKRILLLPIYKTILCLLFAVFFIFSFNSALQLQTHN